MVMLLPSSRRPPTRTTIPELPKLDFTPQTRAWTALRYIEENPWDWDQGLWERCFAGRVVKQAGVLGEMLSSRLGVREAAMHLLQVDGRQADKLFGGGVSLRKLRRRVTKYFGEDPFES
jgi:hypothetical protein